MATTRKKRPLTKPSVASRKRRDSGLSTARVRIEEDARALIWVLSEEGHSHRAIAKRLTIAPNQVWAELNSDPKRHEQVRARIMEQRAQRWKSLESVGLDETQAWIEELRKIRVDEVLSDKQRAILPHMANFLRAIHGTAAQAAKLTQLLSGEATERMENRGLGYTTEAKNEEQLIKLAIEVNELRLLPPWLIPKAEEEMARMNCTVRPALIDSAPDLVSTTHVIKES